MTDTLHLEEVCISNSKSMPACAAASQCVKAETVTPGLKHIPSVILLAVKSQMRSAVLMEQVYENSNTQLLFCMISWYCAYPEKYFATDVYPYIYLH